jgi:peptidoglycan/LPS O-acetylase OafA/YrhL
MAISRNMPIATGATRILYGATVSAHATPLSGLHIGALDGVRGVAILLVLFYHLGRSAQGFGFQNIVLKASGFGWCGVDLFFVLSGFLITGILYDSRNSEFYFRNFYVRRILRIFPLYYAALLLVVLLAALWPQAGVWGTHSSLWIAFYLTNILLVAEGAAAAGIVSHFWSLAIEEHFYLVWPFVVRWGTRRQLMTAAAALAAGAFALRVALVLSGADVEAPYVLTPARIDALAIGALCALAVRGPAGPAGVARTALVTMLVSGASLLLVILGPTTVSYRDPVMQTAGYTLIAVASGAAIITGITWQPLKSVLDNAILRWFGRYSYGLYVWHAIVGVFFLYTPLKSAVGATGPTGSILLLFFSLVTTILLSVASYHLWEKPFLKLKTRFY